MIVLVFALFLPRSGMAYERRITHINDILEEGVYIDYRYNDTDNSDSIGGLPSAPGCPKNDAGLPWVYYPPGGVTPETRCYLAGSRGPCPPYEKIFAEKGNPFGYCNCECFENVEGTDSNREMLCNSYRPYEAFRNVFHPGTKKCYQLYSQGHCGKNEWLVEVEGRTDIQNRTEHINSNEPLTKCEERKCAERLHPSWTTSPSGDVFLKCAFPKVNGGRGGAYSNLIPSTCSNDNENYSILLKKCIRKFSYVSAG